MKVGVGFAVVEDLNVIDADFELIEHKPRYRIPWFRLGFWAAFVALLAYGASIEPDSDNRFGIVLSAASLWPVMSAWHWFGEVIQQKVSPEAAELERRARLGLDRKERARAAREAKKRRSVRLDFRL